MSKTPNEDMIASKAKDAQEKESLPNHGINEIPNGLKDPVRDCVSVLLSESEKRKKQEALLNAFETTYDILRKDMRTIIHNSWEDIKQTLCSNNSAILAKILKDYGPDVVLLKIIDGASSPKILLVFLDSEGRQQRLTVELPS